MIVAERGSVIRLIWWQWRFAVMSLAAATIVTLAYEVGGQDWFLLPTTPLAVVGAAMGIFVSFRTNSCYDRWWEGRKLWGRLINTSRHMAIQSLAYQAPTDPAVSTRCIRRHIAYVHTLRCLLREQAPLKDESVLAYLDREEASSYQGSSNMTAQLLRAQMNELLPMNKSGVLNDFRLSDFDETIRHLLDIQGGCERIKKTPLPRAYGFFSERMIQWFSVLFPCSIVGHLSWGTIFISFLVAFCFKLISETGRVLEDPFNMYYNALPLGALSRTIEVNLLELMGEEDLPEMIKPSSDGILM
jgi:putative membrane protein